VKLFARSALLPEGFVPDVCIEIGGDGVIAAVAAESPCPAASEGEVAAGPVVPAMPNVHSHAFQRALAGRTGAAGPSRDDSFWTWRQAMYAFLDRLDPDAFAAICAQAYVEMVRAGYATVAEFHYVHHDPAGHPYANRAELAQRVVAAAKEAGIGLTLLPVLYAHAGFGGMPTVAGQRRFVHTGPSFARLYEQLAAGAANDAYVLGIAPHSLRAVTPEELRYVMGLAGAQTPLHIHAAEQTKEVDACFAWSSMRPVEWLLAHAGVDPRWCIVHATHMTAAETRDLATTGAVVGLAPTTEADLGDGTFPGEAYLALDGRFGVGSDSNTQVDPFAELRQLEWSQRMRARRRLIMTTDAEATIGTALWSRAARGGAQAVGRPTGAIEVGRRADLVVLNTNDPALTGQDPTQVLDAAIFGPARAPVRDVMIAGRWVVREGRHPRQDEVFARYRAALARIG
jgi:formimidoylglutamate deiminase